MKFYPLYLQLFLPCCATNHESAHFQALPINEPSYTENALEQYTEFQKRCDEILEVFRRREFLFSIEPYEERRSLILDIIAFDQGVYLPKSLDECLSELQNY